ncbi:type II secretion system protein [Colwelliaceae bacterium 6471]
MTFLSKKQIGFSLIELMVVMAIMAVLMSLSGGLFQKSINQQERHIELENIHQIFKQLTYQAYYNGAPQRVRLQEHQLLFVELVDEAVSDENRLGLEAQYNYRVLNAIEFKQLLFVAQDYEISSKGIISPSEFSIFSGNGFRKYPLASIFNRNE